MNKNTICFVAGKSGGHIVPCLTLIPRYRYKDHPLSVLFFSSNTLLDEKIISQSTDVSLHIKLPLNTIKKTTFLCYFSIMWHGIYSLLLSFYYLCKNRPSCIITTGGVVAIPVCIAGFIVRIPITLYSLDAVPGKAIQFLTPLASSIVVTFQNAQKFFPAHKTNYSHYPVRYTPHDQDMPQLTALTTLNLDPNKKTIAILGGSQGSLFLNTIIKQWVEQYPLDAQICNIIHQTGSDNSIDWHEFYRHNNISTHAFNYSPNLAHIYRAADIIICRAGAGTLFEVEFFKKKCIVIPLRASTTNHQVDNAREITHDYPHLFTWLEQKDIEHNPELLFSLLRNTCAQNSNHVNTEIAPLTPN